MEEHSAPMNSDIAKRLWNILRVAFFMMRKGLLSKRKLIMDMNMMMKRGKLLRKSLRNLMFHHHHHYNSKTLTRGGFGIQEYEFSCSNSPNPVFFHVAKRKHYYFPCINPPPTPRQGEEDQEESKAVVVLPTIDYSFSSELAPGENRSPLSVRISNYSSDEEEDGIRNGRVDDDAEEFIRRFYEQLRTQSRTPLLPYREMLPGGTC